MAKKPTAKPTKSTPKPTPVKAVPKSAPAPVAPTVPAAVVALGETLPDIYSKTMALALDRSKFGNRRKVSMGAVEVSVVDAAQAEGENKADKNMLSLSKRLLKSAELKAIDAIDNEAASYLFDVCVPSFFRPGIHLVPLAAVDKVDAKLTDLKAQRATLVETFIAAYPAAVEAMREVLGELFNPLEYPSDDAMRQQFAFSWRYLNLGAPTQLQSVSAKVYAEQRQQIQAQVNDAAMEIRTMMRGTMAELVKHMVDRLTPDPDGKPKVFRDSLIKNFNTFLENFELRNVTNDAQLQALVADAKKLIAGVDPKTLRDNDAMRAAVVSGVEKIKVSLDTMVVSGRAINLDDDEPVSGGVMSPAKKAALTRAANRTKVA